VPLTSSIVLAGRSGPALFNFYGIVLVGQVLFFLLAGVGALLELRARRDEIAPAPDAMLPVRTSQPEREIA